MIILLIHKPSKKKSGQPYLCLSPCPGFLESVLVSQIHVSVPISLSIWNKSINHSLLLDFLFLINYMSINYLLVTTCKSFIMLDLR